MKKGATTRSAKNVAQRFLYPQERTAFNKYNPTELVGQLLKVLNDAGLEDTVKDLKSKGFTKLINKAWQSREK